MPGIMVALFSEDKLAIEKVQRRALRIALGQKLREMLYEERCILLNWNTLQHRREYLSVVEFYKTVSGLNGLQTLMTISGFVELKTLEPTIHNKYELY